MAREVHHPRSFSRLALRMRCPGSEREEHEMGLTTPSQDQSRGTRIHAAIAAGDPQLTDSPWERVIVRRAMDYEDAVLTRFGCKLVRALSEEPLEVRARDGHIATAGTPDRILLVNPDAAGEPQGALVIEWKPYMASHPDADSIQWQLTGQALGVLQHWPKLKGVIALCYNPAQEIEYAEMRLKREKMLVPLAEIERLSQQAAEPEPIYRPGDHCARCPAAGRCLESARNAAIVLAEWESQPVVRRKGEKLVIIDDHRFAQRWAGLKALESRVEAMRRELEGVYFDATLDGYENEWLETRDIGALRSIVDYTRAMDTLPPAVSAELQRISQHKWNASDLEDAVAKVEGLRGKAAKARAMELLGDNFRLTPRKPSLRLRRMSTQTKEHNDERNTDRSAPPDTRGS